MATLLKPSLISIALLLGACSEELSTEPVPQTTEDEANPAILSEVQATFDTASGTYALSWSVDPSGAPVDLFVSENRDGSNPVLIADDRTETSLSWTPDNNDRKRRYFVVQPDAGEAQVFATRLLPLEGGRNFRDLGGYETITGGVVKWGHVFRSGVMDGLTDADYDYLSDLGIKVVCDFRESDERTREPTDWKAGEIEYLTFAEPEGENNPEDNPMFAALLSSDTTSEDVATSMANSYFDMAMNEREGYTAMFDRLAAGDIPLAFNCSAGKDRAGTAAALLLTVLGVPRDMVVYDYSLSDDYVDYMAEFINEETRAEAANDPDNPYAVLMQLPPEKVAPLMASDPRYIETSFAEMEERYGSVMGFIKTELDVTDEEIESIRAQLVQ